MLLIKHLHGCGEGGWLSEVCLTLAYGLSTKNEFLLSSVEGGATRITEATTI